MCIRDRNRTASDSDTNVEEPSSLASTADNTEEESEFVNTDFFFVNTNQCFL